MFKNRFVLIVCALSLSAVCFASDDIKVIESSTNENLVKTLRLHEDVMLKLIHKTSELEKKISSLEEKILKIESTERKNNLSTSGSGAVEVGKYDKEFRAYIEASKKAK